MVKMPKNRLESRRSFIINITYFAIIAALFLLFFRYVVGWLMPFIVGFMLASSANPIVTKICDKTKVNRKICGFVILLLEYVILVLLFWYLGTKVINSAQLVFANLPRYFDENIVPMWNSIKDSINHMTKDLPPETLEQLSAVTDGAFGGLRDLFSGLSERVVSFVAQTTSQIPFYFLSIIFTVLSSFFICMEYDKIKEFVKKLLPRRIVDLISDTKLQLGKTLLKYAKAYGIILLMTFTELLIGLSILGVDNALGIAAIIAVFDILPVLGTGGIMIPWAIFSFSAGNYFLGVGLLVVYLITIIIRNFAEPKIIGMQLGLHPLVTLVTIYVGYRIYGILGMIGFPVCVTILIALHKTGRLKFKEEFFGIDSDPSEEEPEEADPESAESAEPAEATEAEPVGTSKKA